MHQAAAQFGHHDARLGPAHTIRHETVRDIARHNSIVHAAAATPRRRRPFPQANRHSHRSFIFKEQSRVRRRSMRVMAMRAIAVEIGARTAIKRLGGVIPTRHGGDIAPIGIGNIVSVTFIHLHITQLWPDGFDHFVALVTCFALIAVGHGIAECACHACIINDRHPFSPARQPQIGVAAVGAPDIGQCHPARCTVQQKARLDCAGRPVALAKGEAFDNCRTDRKTDQPVTIGRHLRSARQIDEPRLD